MIAVRVTAPLVVVADASGKLRYRYLGATLGADEIGGEDAARLLDMGMVEQVEVADEFVIVDDEGDTGSDESGDDAADNEAGSGASSATTDAPARPRQTTSPKDEWVAYAVSRGMSEAEAVEMTRAELAARFPEA